MKTENELRTFIPVYINTFNLPTYTGRLVKQFVSHGFKNIIIIDQASEGEDSIELLLNLEKCAFCKVVRQKHNRGPRYFFDSLRFLTAGKFFFYTDPDIELPEKLHPAFVTRLIALSHEFKIGKVGCALDISDHHLFDQTACVQEHESEPATIIDFESRYWKSEIRPDIYRAQIDTTLALYNLRYFRLWSFFEALRVSGEFTIKHRPWYIDKRMADKELEYYKQRCSYSSWLNSDSSGNSLFKLTPATYVIKQLKFINYLIWRIKERVRRYANTNESDTRNNN